MKMPNEVSIIMTQEIKNTPPPKPIKGFRPWGVGKEYRRNRRRYAKLMRQFKKGPKTRLIKVFIPVANVEMVTATPAEPRDNHWDQPRKIPTSFQAEFTIKPSSESRGLFFGQ